MLDDPSCIARFRSAFGDQLRTVNDQLRLVTASREPGVELVVVPVRDRHGQSLVTSVSAIRASRQGATVYVYADRSSESLHALIPLTRAGARGVIVRDVDDDGPRLRRLLDASLDHAVESIVIAAQQLVPARQLPLVLLCLEHVRTPLAATVFARRLGVSRRTLSAWAGSIGARGVRPLTARCRVLVAIRMIRDSAQPLEHIAHELCFASSAHLHNTIRRYTGLSPRVAATKDASHWCQVLLAPGSPAGNPPASRGMVQRT